MRAHGPAVHAEAAPEFDKPKAPQHTTPPQKLAVLPGNFSVANTKSAEKVARQAEKHRAHNVTLRSRMRSAIRKVNDAIASGNAEQARSSYVEALPTIDTLVNKRIIHRNKADRHKSRLAARVKAMTASVRTRGS